MKEVEEKEEGGEGKREGEREEERKKEGEGCQHQNLRGLIPLRRSNRDTTLLKNLLRTYNHDQLVEDLKTNI